MEPPTPSPKHRPSSSHSGGGTPILDSTHKVKLVSAGGNNNTSPLLPQRASYLALAAVYPLTLFLASFSTLLFTPAPNYFSQKYNLFNTVFVKYGWFWTSTTYFYHISRLRRTSLHKALLRWALATIWWYLVTQWCFGPPIMDRTFIWSGGACRVLENSASIDLNSLDLGMLQCQPSLNGSPKGAGCTNSIKNSNPTNSLPTKMKDSSLTPGEFLVTSVACKLAGGQWTGGHDLSGHVFMLTHASLFLINEWLPILFVGSERQKNHWATWSVGGLLVLWWWMLVMTGVHFHTWREKLTGFLASLVEWYVVYQFSLQNLPAVRDILGVPGV